jgi:arylsulfatase A-like enzyme
VAGADAAIGRLVDDLDARGRWSRSLLIVTADHGFTAIEPGGVVALGPVLARARLTGVVPVADGGVEHLYAIGDDPGPTLARAAALAASTPGVAEVLARIPIPGVPALSDRHLDWHLDHERTGDLLLVAAPGHQFVDPDDPVDAHLRGNHGGPQDLAIPLVVTGGLPALRRAPENLPARTVDLAPTIAAVLGIRLPHRLDGTPIPPASSGRVLKELLR